MNKPKKALKGLFSRTEPAEKQDTQVYTAAKSPEAAASIIIPSSLSSTEIIAVPTIAPESVEIATTAESAEVAISENRNTIQDSTQSAEISKRLNQQRQDQLETAFLGVQYNFELHRAERSSWRESEYLEFIKRIDVAQTEAFFLKGALLDEVKKRFFENNKSSWKDFAEQSLGMNYTTANQYIRVAQEFDVTSHQRPDFGFEHYKALLPLGPALRQQLIGELPPLSVKALRNVVHKKLTSSDPSPGPARSVGRLLVELLVNVKRQAIECSPDLLSQKETWQLIAACRNVADDLKSLAEQLHKNQVYQPTFLKPRDHAHSDLQEDMTI